jgi:MarR family transcriptional regulator, lower aerobic nicotinate degradation pathway regulator
MDYRLLKEIIPLLEDYEKHCSQNALEPDMEKFMLWYLDKNKLSKGADNFKSPSMEAQGDENARITQLLALMHKYLRFYLKKAFEGSPLSSPDDFGFLATLLIVGKMRKNELIEKNTMEFSSGVEIIKRLEKNGLIESVTDSADKRAKLVDLTRSGKMLIVHLLPIMGQIGQIATAGLEGHEKTFLLEILTKLNLFHNPVFHQAKKESIAEIKEKFMGT